MNLTARRETRSFVLRKGRTTEAQKKAIQRYMPIYGIRSCRKKLNYRQVFCQDNPVIIEIGFGSGEATIKVAEKNPNINYIVIDVYPPGIGKLLQKANDLSLQNIRIINDDAKNIISGMIYDDSLAGIHIFFPDPWPKKKHHKRRLLTFDFMIKLEKKLRQNGYIHIVTDWEEYGDSIETNINLINNLELNATRQKSITMSRPQTKFEKRGLDQGNRVREIVVFKKTS